MKFISWINLKINKMDAWDIALIKWSCLVFGVLLASLIPVLTRINFWWLIIAVAVLASRPFYRILLKK